MLGIINRIVIMSLFAGSVFAHDNPSVAHTKSQLQQLEARILHLKQNLATAHDKQGLIDKELAITEKQIGVGVKKLRDIQHAMANKKQKIQALELKVTKLNRLLSTQQELLAQHLRARFKMGEYHPLKLIINQNDPQNVSRILTFHQYLVRSRQKIIDDIDHTKHTLTENQQTLKKELLAQSELQQKLHMNQTKLERSKSYHHAVMNSLNNDIQTQEQTLSEAQRNKENLSRLLASLSSQNLAYSKLPFVKMRHKLPLPIKVDRRNLQKSNQGVQFYAAEGTAVTAVYPGKVVFSDWLNGYGLLLIIDHGQGFMTLYAHSQAVFKQKGSKVLQGEQIALAGHSGGIKQNGLYFEVRQHGKAVSPLDWLS